MNLLEKCFEGAPNVPKRLIKVPENLEKAKEHLEKSNHNIFAAKSMHDNKFFDWTITCAYYSMYHATMASLWLIGLDARSHECAIAAFEAFYVKKMIVDKDYTEYIRKAKTLSKKYSETLEYAKSERIKASYGVGEITSQEATRVLNDARNFLAEITKIVSEVEGI